MNFYVNSGLDNLHKAKMNKADLQIKLEHTVFNIIIFSNLFKWKTRSIKVKGKKWRRDDVKCAVAILQPRSAQ